MHLGSKTIKPEYNWKVFYFFGFQGPSLHKVLLEFKVLLEIMDQSQFNFLFVYFNWRMIALQFWVGFCRVSAWICRRFAYVPSLVTPPPPPPHPTPQGWHRAPGRAPRATQRIPPDHPCYIQCICFPATLSIHLTLSSPPLPVSMKSVLYVCLLIAALQIGSSVPSFRFHLHMLI